MVFASQENSYLQMSYLLTKYNTIQYKILFSIKHKTYCMFRVNTKKEESSATDMAKEIKLYPKRVVQIT